MNMTTAEKRQKMLELAMKLDEKQVEKLISILQEENIIPKKESADDEQ